MAMDERRNAGAILTSGGRAFLFVMDGQGYVHSLARHPGEAKDKVGDEAQGVAVRNAIDRTNALRGLLSKFLKENRWKKERNATLPIAAEATSRA